MYYTTAMDEHIESEIDYHSCSNDNNFIGFMDSLYPLLEDAPDDFDLCDYHDDIEEIHYAFYYTNSDDEIHKESREHAVSITTNETHVEILYQIITEYWLLYNNNYRSKLNARKRWTILKCAVKILAIHKQAVITANHPNRLKLLGAFDVIDDISVRI